MFLIPSPGPACQYFAFSRRYLASVDAGDRICLDDGKIEGVVESASTEELRIRVKRTPPRGARLRADKGINLPDSALELPALSERDKSTLEFVASHADLVGLSFVNRPSDVAELIDRLHANPGPWAGPHVQQALTVLDDILKRMEPHQSKKRAMLRALRIATEYKGT